MTIYGLARFGCLALSILAFMQVMRVQRCDPATSRRSWSLKTGVGGTIWASLLQVPFLSPCGLNPRKLSMRG